MLNAARRAHPALRQLRNLEVHWSDDDAILVYSKHLDAALSPTGASDTVIVVANVDPHSAVRPPSTSTRPCSASNPARRTTSKTS